MSEYQYYEFRAVDQQLTEDEQKELRRISSSARITPTSLIADYQWGDFRGKPDELMEKYFDLHLYQANWGSQRLMVRLPRSMVRQEELEAFKTELDWLKVWESGDNLIIDIYPAIEESDTIWVDEEGENNWLVRMAPLRTDILSGDLRMFYLLWLAAVQVDCLPDHAIEPLPGIGPLSDAHYALAEFFDIDCDLIEAAASSHCYDISALPLKDFVSSMPETEKTSLLVRVIEGDSRVSLDLRKQVRVQHGISTSAGRTVGELRAAALEVEEQRRHAEAEKIRIEKEQEAERAEKARRERLADLEARGEKVWDEVEAEIMRRYGVSYKNAAVLLTDLKQLAAENGTTTDFFRRLNSIRERHSRKPALIKRIQTL